jgi:hypothetical protein
MTFNELQLDKALTRRLRLTEDARNATPSLQTKALAKKYRITEGEVIARLEELNANKPEGVT